MKRDNINGVVVMRGMPRLSVSSQDKVQTQPEALSDPQRFVAGADVFSRPGDKTTITAMYDNHGIALRCPFVRVP